MSTDQSSLEGLDPEIAALVGSAPEDADVSEAVVGDFKGPSRKDLEQMKKEADTPPTAAEQDRTIQRQIGRWWAGIVPGATMAIVYHKPHSGPGAGALRIINRYNIRDIQAGGGDLTLFTLNDLAPTWGPGDYHYYVIDPKTHREIHVAHIPVAEKPAHAKESQDVSLSNTLMQHFLKDLSETKKATMTQQPPDPFEQMKKAKEAMAMLVGENGKTDPMMLMLVMQMMQPKQEAPKSDPMLVALIERMDRRMEAMEKKVSEEKAPPPPPPPPPPGPDVVDVIAKLAPLLKPEKPEVSTLDIVKMMQEARKDDDRLGLKDVIALLDRRQGPDERPLSLKEKFEEFMALKEMAAHVAGGGGGGGEDNFWTALRSLFEHPALASGIGKALEKSAGREAQPRVISNEPRRMQSPAPAAHIPARTQETAHEEQAEQPQRAAAEQAAAEQPPKVPEAIKPKLATIEKSLHIPDELEARKARVVATVEALVVLWNDPNWNKFVVELLTYVVENNQEQALRGLGGFLGFMGHHGLLASEAGKATFFDFRDNWEALQPELTSKLGPFLHMAPKAPAQEVPKPAPEPEEESDEESDEEESEDEEAEDEDSTDTPAEAVAAGAPLFVTDLPSDGIEALYQQAQRNVIG